MLHTNISIQLKVDSECTLTNESKEQLASKKFDAPFYCIFECNILGGAKLAVVYFQ